jgi:hypothetical protein
MYVCMNVCTLHPTGFQDWDLACWEKVRKGLRMVEAFPRGWWTTGAG